jgi:ferredoxin
MTEKVRVVVDGSRCQAYGVCVTIHPEVFDVPPGQPAAVVLRDVVDAEDREDVEEAARACPAQAISLRPVSDTGSGVPPSQIHPRDATTSQ